MAFDLFISHSRRDYLNGRITQLIERLNREFEKLYGRELKPFFDTEEVRSWDEWRDRILPRLQQSQLFLAYLTPAYFESEHCEWDVNAFLKQENARGLAGDGIVVVDSIDWSRWQEDSYIYRFLHLHQFRELSRRTRFDLRGKLEETELLRHLASQIAILIRRIERSESSFGNIDPFNPHLVGRSFELRRIHAILASGHLCVLGGPSGIGKTATAVEYAHAFAGEYGGGRWQVKSLSEFTAVLDELRKLALINKSNRCLLVLDDVTEPELLVRTQSERILANNADWLHVIATTRLREEYVRPSERGHSFLTIQRLPETDARHLLESFQPVASFPGAYHRDIARQTLSLLDGFPLAIEAAGASSRYFLNSVRLEDLIKRVSRAKEDGADEDHARSLTAMMEPIVTHLSEAERSALTLASQLGDPFDLSLMHEELIRDIREFHRYGKKPGFPSSWDTLLNHLFSLRLWQPTTAVDAKGELQTARMHPLVRLSIQRIFSLEPTRDVISRDESIHGVAVLGNARISGVRITEIIGERSDRTTGKEQIQTPHPLDDNVMFTVYRRKTIAPNKWYPLLAFAHLSERRPDAPPDEADPGVEVKRQAQALLGVAIANYKESSEDSSQAIPRSGELLFKPSVPGIEFNPPSRTFKWEEPVHREEFKMRATKELEGQVARGYLRVFLGPIIVAEVNLAFKVDSNVVASDVALDLQDHARPFRKVFASYSHKDKSIVEHIEKLVRDSHLGLEYLRDVTKLRSGNVWNDSLLQMIDTADVFQLFWSRNSMDSKYVKREYEHALARQLPDFVRPVYWEKPFPERPEQGLPPEELRRLHFEELSFATERKAPAPPRSRSKKQDRKEIVRKERRVRTDADWTVDRKPVREAGARLSKKRVIQFDDLKYHQSERRAPAYTPQYPQYPQNPQNPQFSRYGPASGGDFSLFAAINALVMVLSLIATLLFLFLKFFGIVPSGMPLLLCSVTFLVSLIVFLIQLRDY